MSICRPASLTLVFLMHVVACCAQQICERRSVSRETSVADVERTGRICGDGLQQDPLSVAKIGTPVLITLGENISDFLFVCACGEREIDKPWSGDFGFLHEA